MGINSFVPDSRGRVRFTHNRVRYEINKDGELRMYRRYLKHRNSEHKVDEAVNVLPLDRQGRNKLWSAIYSARQQRKD